VSYPFPVTVKLIQNGRMSGASSWQACEVDENEKSVTLNMLIVGFNI